MAKTISPISIATDTFAGWLSKTNEILDTLANEVVTVNSTTAGANTTGNGSVIGTLHVETLGVETLRGGSAGNTANISSFTIGFANSSTSSNVNITGYTANIVANNLTITSNSIIGSGTQDLTINVSDVSINTATFSIDATSNAVINTSVEIAGDLTVNNYVAFTDKITLDTKTIRLDFPDTVTTNTVDSFAIADVTGVKYTICMTDENDDRNKALTEISIVYGFGNSHLTEYGTIYSNTQFINFSSEANTTHINLNANSATSNVTFKIQRTSFVAS